MSEPQAIKDILRGLLDEIDRRMAAFERQAQIAGEITNIAGGQEGNLGAMGIDKRKTADVGLNQVGTA